jgi:hypothetical protein
MRITIYGRVSTSHQVELRVRLSAQKFQDLARSVDVFRTGEVLRRYWQHTRARAGPAPGATARRPAAQAHRASSGRGELSHRDGAGRARLLQVGQHGLGSPARLGLLHLMSESGRSNRISVVI